MNGETSGEKNTTESARHWLEKSRAAQQAGDFDGMLEYARQAAKYFPEDLPAALRLAECYLLCGQVREAIALAQELESETRADPHRWQMIGELFTKCSQFDAASRCYRQAVKLRPEDPSCVYNLAASCIAMGRIDEAEQLLSEVIRLNPTDYDAWQNRSSLKKQTTQSHHVKQLLYVLEHLGDEDPGRVAICYALAKELEDLERYKESFYYLQQGASQRRHRMQYDVDGDIETIEQIMRCFNRELLQSAPAPEEPNGPVFVLGLPRSGTTLVDRIISTHSKASSLGEINTLAFAIMQTVSGTESKAARNRIELVERSTQIDFRELGKRYVQAIRGYGQDSALLVDKTPLNFLYIGLIRLAMPNARVIHLRRHPVDSCYAMYKTLFRMGYPFSYSLQDVGRYYIAYHGLMAHWRAVAPDSFLDVDYEELVSQPEEQSRRLIDWCGLDWEPECLEFYRSDAPAATASAAQVRRPIYSSSVGNWRNYEQQLAPFVARLQEHGIKVE
jgi:tetratricopeptide (TPR) repeat protein